MHNVITRFVNISFSYKKYICVCWENNDNNDNNKGYNIDVHNIKKKTSMTIVVSHINKLNYLFL